MKTALVTGSSRGIGRGIADLLCENGYTVVYCGTKPQRPADLAPKADYFPCDISDGAQRRAVRDTVRALRQSADDEGAAFGKLIAEPIGNFLAVAGHAARADNGNAGLTVKIGDASAVIEHSGRVGKRAQPRGIEVALIGKDANSLLAAGLINFLRVRQVLFR